MFASKVCFSRLQELRPAQLIIAETFEAILGHDGHTSYVAVSKTSGRCAGYLILELGGDPKHLRGYVTSIAVLPLFRSHGVAQQLLQEALSEAQRHHAQAVELHVHTRNEGAIKLYRRCGFEVLEEQYIKPVTAAAGNVSWALMKNPDGLPAYLLRMAFITHGSFAAGLLLPLAFMRKCILPVTILTIPFMFLFLLSLSLGQCGGYKYHLQKFAVIGLTVVCNVSYAGKVTMGYVLFEENWLFALEYVSMGCSVEADKLKILEEVKRSGHETLQYIKPVTAAAGNVSWALMKNPDGLPWRSRRRTSPDSRFGLEVPFMVLFLLSFGRCGGYKPLLQNLGVLGVTLTANVGYGCAIITGRALFEHNWLFALQYISLGFFGTLGMDADLQQSMVPHRVRACVLPPAAGHFNHGTCKHGTDPLRGTSLCSLGLRKAALPSALRARCAPQSDFDPRVAMAPPRSSTKKPYGRLPTDVILPQADVDEDLASFYVFRDDIVMFPISYSIPKDRILSELPKKTQLAMNDSMKSFQFKNYKFGPHQERPDGPDGAIGPDLSSEKISTESTARYILRTLNVDESDARVLFLPCSPFDNFPSYLKLRCTGGERKMSRNPAFRMSPYEPCNFYAPFGDRAHAVPEYYMDVSRFYPKERVALLYGDDSGIDDAVIRTQLYRSLAAILLSPLRPGEELFSQGKRSAALAHEQRTTRYEVVEGNCEAVEKLKQSLSYELLPPEDEVIHQQFCWAGFVLKAAALVQYYQPDACLDDLHLEGVWRSDIFPRHCRIFCEISRDRYTRLLQNAPSNGFFRETGVTPQEVLLLLSQGCASGRLALTLPAELPGQEKMGCSHHQWLQEILFLSDRPWSSPLMGEWQARLWLAQGFRLHYTGSSAEEVPVRLQSAYEQKHLILATKTDCRSLRAFNSSVAWALFGDSAQDTRGHHALPCLLEGFQPQHVSLERGSAHAVALLLAAGFCRFKAHELRGDPTASVAAGFDNSPRTRTFAEARVESGRSAWNSMSAQLEQLGSDGCS
eukprot:g30244.t1